MIINSESEMLSFGRNFAKTLHAPAVLELVGDVGAGKTTFVRGLAEGLGVKDPVTSPSFTISKSYAFPDGILTHYDFYRLSDPGIMQEDLSEAINSDNAIVVVEWADSVSDFLPATRQTIKISYREDGAREVIL